MDRGVSRAAVEFSFLVRSRRKELGLPLHAVADALGISSVIVHYLETGDYRRGSFVLRMALCQILGLDSMHGLLCLEDGERAIKFVRRFGTFCGLEGAIIEPTIMRIRKKFGIPEEGKKRKQRLWERSRQVMEPV